MQDAGAESMTVALTTSPRPHAFRMLMKEMRRDMPVSTFRSRRRPLRLSRLEVVPTFVIISLGGWLIGLVSLLVPEDLASRHLTLSGIWSEVCQSMPDAQHLAVIEHG